MRVATLILGLVLGGTLAALSVWTKLFAVAGSATGGAGDFGLLMAVLFLVGTAFVFALPRVSAWAFGVAGVLGLVLAISPAAGALGLFGAAALVLAWMAWSARTRKPKATVAPGV